MQIRIGSFTNAKIVALGACALLMLSSCTASPSEPTVLPTQIRQTATPTVRASATATATQASTPIPLQVQSVTLTPRAPQPVFSDPDEEKILLSFRQLERESLYGGWSERSPDERWTLTLNESHGTLNGMSVNYVRYYLEANDSDTSFILFDNVNYEGIGGNSVVILQWPNEEHELLYRIGGLGDMGCLALDYGRRLTRVNIATRKVEVLIVRLGASRISPDGKYIVYSPDYYPDILGEVSLQTLSLVDGSHRVWLLPLKDVPQIGGFVWSPDQKSVVFAANTGSCATETQIVRFDFDSETAALLTTVQGEVVPLSWGLEGIFVSDDYGHGEFTYLIDPANGQVLNTDS